MLINLLENAREAIGEGGSVTIEGRLEDNSMVSVDVVDDGAGIPEEVLTRIFEPRFSTRSKGAGLGLPIVQRLVATWGGTVTVASEVGVGTTVTLHIPVWLEEST